MESNRRLPFEIGMKLRVMNIKSNYLGDNITVCEIPTTNGYSGNKYGTDVYSGTFENKLGHINFDILKSQGGKVFGQFIIKSVKP